MTISQLGNPVRSGAGAALVLIEREGSTALVRAGGRLDAEGRRMLAESLERLTQTGARYVTVRLVSAPSDDRGAEGKDGDAEAVTLRRLLHYAGQRLGELGGYLSIEHGPRIDLTAGRKID